MQKGADNAVRIAAVGDVHFGVDSRDQLRPHLANIADKADLLLLAGDLTRYGTVEEAKVLADDLAECPVPVVAVLGNHDYHSDQEERIMDVLISNGTMALEGATTLVDVHGISVGIAGTKGFGGGFRGACGSEFGEPLIKEFIGHTRELSEQLQRNLESLEATAAIRIALLHFSPVEETLRGERLEIYPWLGSYLLADAIDHAGCDMVFHGHAHAGAEVGTTPGGVPVRNVAQALIRAPYKVYDVSTRDL